MKPTVFFSHSSLDKDRIKPIKDHILEKTGNAIQIFMSSDGASIPFGKNWLKEIELALTTCKLMFVWLTPNSSKNNWIYFESGYAYSRDIKVVPIGFDGIKLEELPAPLNLLQGFNINSASSLNNIIAVINREFGLTFHYFFDENYFENIVSKSSLENSPELLEYINAIRVTFPPKIVIGDNNNVSLKPKWFQIFKDVLEENSETFTIERHEFYGIGYKIRTVRHKTPYPEIVVDPLSLNNILNILFDLNLKAYEQKNNKLILAIDENPSYELPADHFLISSRLINTEVDFKTALPHVLYRYRNILFRININEDIFDRLTINNKLIIIVDQKDEGPIPLLSLIKLLINQKVINKI